MGKNASGLMPQQIQISKTHDDPGRGSEPYRNPLATKQTYGFDFRWIFTKKTWIFPSAQMRKTKAHPDQSRSL